MLTHDQAEVLAAYGWQTVDMLLDPDEGIPAARSSMACRYGGTEGWGWETSSACIAAWRCPGPRPAEVFITWAEVRTAAKNLPEWHRANLGAARRRARRQLQRTVAPYLPGGYAPFVHPNPAWLRDAQVAQTVALRAALEALVQTEELALFAVDMVSEGSAA